MNTIDSSKLFEKNAIESASKIGILGTLLFSTQATIPNIQATLFTYTHALAVLLGMLPGDLEKIKNETEKIPTISSDIAIGAPAELLRRRPDIRRAEMQAAAQSAQIGIARTDLFPISLLCGMSVIRLERKQI